MFNEQTTIRIQPTTPGECGAREQGETTTAWIKARVIRSLEKNLTN